MKLINYPLGLFFIIPSIAGIFTDFFFGMILMLIGLVIFPPTYAKISEKLSFISNRKGRLASVVILFFLLLYFTPKVDQRNEDNLQPTAESVAKQPIKLSVEEIAPLIEDIETKANEASTYPELLFVRDKISDALSKAGDAAQLERLTAIETDIKAKLAVKEANFETEKKLQASLQQKELVAFKGKISSKFSIKKEEIRDATFYTHKRFNGLKNFTGAYVASNFSAGSTPILRFKAMYFGQNWLFVESMRFKCAEESFFFNFRPFSDKQFERDNSGGSVWEYVDLIPTSEQLSLLRCASDLSKKVIYSFEGKQYRKDLTMSKEDQRAIGDTLKLYDNFKELGL